MEVTAAELAVLEQLWELGVATRRDLVQRLYPTGRESDRATVQKLLERLAAKQLVERDSSERVHRFSAAVTRDEYVGSQLNSLARSVCGGSFEPLISHLVRADRLSESDLSELRQLIDAPPQPAPSSAQDGRERS